MKTKRALSVNATQIFAALILIECFVCGIQDWHRNNNDQQEFENNSVGGSSRVIEKYEKSY